MWRDHMSKEAPGPRDARPSNSLEELVKSEMSNAETAPRPKPKAPKAPTATRPPKIEEQASTQTETKAMDTARQETSARESQVRQKLKEQQMRMRLECEKLAKVENELRKISAQEQADIGILRSQLEEVDRQLAAADKEYKFKEAAYTKAKVFFLYIARLFF